MKLKCNNKIKLLLFKMLRNDAFKFTIGTCTKNEIICNIMSVQSKLEKGMTYLKYWIKKEIFD